MPAIRDEEDDEKTLSDVAGLHPAGQFLCVVAQIPKFRAEVEETKNNQKTGNILIDDYWVFSLETQDNEGVRRVIDTNKMTGKPFSGNSAMGKLLSAMFGNAKPAELEAIIPKLSYLLDKNFLVNVKHEQSKNGAAVYAQVGGMSHVPLIPSGEKDKATGKMIMKPAYDPITTSDEYQNFFDRKLGYERIDDPANPGKKIWFKALYVPKEGEDSDETPTAGNARQPQEQVEQKPAPIKAAKGAAKAEGKF
jgi:SepF-like predicted cell division protein (DUF552 family)